MLRNTVSLHTYLVVQIDDIQEVRVEIQQKILADSYKQRLTDLRLRIITTLCGKKFFMERTLGNLMDLEKALNLKYNVADFPISFHNLPKLEIQHYLKKSNDAKFNKDSKQPFTTVDVKMMIGSCTNFLNSLSSNPLFFHENLRSFLGLRNLNFRELDLYIQNAQISEKENYRGMQGSILNFDLRGSPSVGMSPAKQQPDDSQQDNLQSSVVNFKDLISFRGEDRTTVGGVTRYTLFCKLGDSSWYISKAKEELQELIDSCKGEDRIQRDEWARMLLRVNGKGSIEQEVEVIRSLLSSIAQRANTQKTLLQFVKQSHF